MSLLLTLANPHTIPKLSNPSFAAMNTTVTNSLGADGLTWAQALQPAVDKYGKVALLVQRSAGSLSWTISNNSGATWVDLSSPGDGAYPVPVARASIAYDSINDKFHVLYLGVPSDGMIYRRYAITRDGSHNITGLVKDSNTNIQFDIDGTGGMDYQHPVILWFGDIGSNGALVCVWHARNGTSGTEVRACMRALTNTSADGVVGNWTHLGVSSTTAIGNAPQVAYTALFSTTANNGATGWPTIMRKSSGAATHANDLYVFFVDVVGGVPTWKMRRMAWATSNWSGGLSAAVTIGAIKRTGTDGGYTLKYQLGSKATEDTQNNLVYFSYCDWKSNTDGDTWLFKTVDGSDAVSAPVDVYSGGAANCGTTIFVTGDIFYDTSKKALVVAFTNLPNKDALVALYRGATRIQAPFSVFTSAPVDIPIVVHTRVNNKIAIVFRNFNTQARQNPPTYTPPYTGYWGTLSF